MREIKYVSNVSEVELADMIGDRLFKDSYNASNSVIVSVSTDYSSIVGQILRHQLSFDGEICDGFGVDVPYPDEEWDEKYVNEVMAMFKLHAKSIYGKNIILIEAGVIRGGNYTKVVDLIRRFLEINEKIVTVALYENLGSRFKSDYVGEYYNDELEDLTFWWERDNNHWKE
jgi:hypothetical protein